MIGGTLNNTETTTLDSAAKVPLCLFQPRSLAPPAGFTAPPPPHAPLVFATCIAAVRSCPRAGGLCFRPPHAIVSCRLSVSWPTDSAADFPGRG